jgi:pimeloyl-ACP methyl ester carboxylesterase
MHVRISGSDSIAGANVVNVDDAQVAYRVQGKGPAVVLVNGTGALDVHWGHVIEVLSSQRTVISLDYSGSGDTVDDGGALTLEKLARQVVGVAKAAGAETFDLNSPQTRAVADSIPRASYKEADAGHIVLFERADEFIALATEFLFQQHDNARVERVLCSTRLH